MAQTGDLIIVALVNDKPLKTGFACQRNDWPYHVTLMTWFTCADEKLLNKKLLAFAIDLQPFTAYIGRQTNFGVNGDIPVNLIVNTSDFLPLHRQLLGIVQSISGSSFDGRWTGDAYQPHVTRHFEGTQGVEPGKSIFVEGFYTVRLTDSKMCKVETFYPFGVRHG